MITSIIAAIISISKTSALVDKWAQIFIDSYVNDKIKSMESSTISIQLKKRVILSKISEAKNNEEKCALFSTYNDLCKL